MTERFRDEPVHEGDERATLTTFLDYQRGTLEWKCAGLTAEQLRRREVPPSEISLLGLVRHMAEVERSWFRVVVNGEKSVSLWTPPEATAAGEYHEFAVVGADPDAAFAAWRAEVARAREIVAATPALDVTGTHPRTGETFSLRWILAHMIEEYARHNGHADLIRERLDGETGE